MPTEVLTQLRALRESIADALRKDPRYLTLTALDKTITEIDGVLKSSGLATAPAKAPPPLQFAESPPSAPSFPAVTPPAYSTDAQGYKPQHPATTAEPVAEPAQAGASSLEAPSPRETEQAADEPKEDELEPQFVAEEESSTSFLEMHEPASSIFADSAPAPLATVEPDVSRADLEAVHSAAGAVELPIAEPAPEPETLHPVLAVAASGKQIHPPIDATSHGEPSNHEEPIHDVAHHADDEVAAPEVIEMPVEHAEPAPLLDHSLMNFQVTDEDESVALALGATGPDEEIAEAEALTIEEAQDAAFTAAELAHRTSGYVPMQAKIGAAIYQPAMSVKFGKLPNKVDLRPLMQPCEDRPPFESGVTQAVADAYEYWIRKSSKQERPISRMFMSYNARWRAGAADTDTGCTIQYALESLIRFGACSESAWPEEHDLMFARPGGEAYRDAALSKIHDMAHVPLRIEAWKQALAEGKPIVFGCATFAGFDECADQGGVIAMPSPEMVADGTPHLRSLCAVGYSERERVFIVRGSEGAAFGDHGHCYIPFDYLMSDVLNDGDCWVFIPKVPSQPPREVWSDDATPVTNGGVGVTFAIEAHRPEDYVAIGRDLFAGQRRPYLADPPEDFAHYVSLAGRGAWDEMEPNDAGLLLAAATLEGGMAALASAFPGSSGARAVGVRSDDVFGRDQGRDGFMASRPDA